MLIFTPFLIITFMAWGVAKALNDDILWRIIFDIVGAISIGLSIALVKTLL